MTKRSVRIVKWLSTTPAIGMCGFCSQQFKVPTTQLAKATDAQASLEEQFDRHKCKRKEIKPPSDQ
jgi:hypothetical protein